MTRQRCAAVASALALALAWGRVGAAQAPPAPGGVRLVAALEEAPLAAVVVLDAPQPIDDEAWRATGSIESSLRGSAPERVSIAWEERARLRPVRFAAGDRVLLALEALPGYSIWQQRIPDPEQRVRTLSIAEGGGAFLRSPSPGGLLVLEHYLSLPPDLRARNAGVGYLIQLAESAERPLAEAAVERLASVRRLDPEIDPTSATRWIHALLRPDASDGLREGLLALCGSAHLLSLRPPLQSLADREPPAPALAFEALGRIEGSLPSARAQRLIVMRDSASHRRVGALYASGAALEQLPSLLRSDPAPEVRGAAAARWLDAKGIAGLDRVRPALRDSDPRVRDATLLELARLGPGAVPALRAEVDSAPPEGARSAVAALALAGGPASARALAEIAELHPDPGVRLLARTALGQPIGHAD